MENIIDNEILALQSDFESNKISLDDLTDLQKCKLIKLYNMQNNIILDDITNLKNEVKITTKKYTELKDMIDN